MDKKRKIIIFSILGVFCIQVVVGFCWLLLTHYDYDNKTRMFNTVDDLSFINEYIVEEDIKLDDAITDELKTYVLESKTVTIEYEGHKIDIFAYTFESTENCIEYATKVSGSDYNYFYTGDSISMFHYDGNANIFGATEKLLVFSNEKAYVIKSEMPTNNFNKFIDYFMNQLPIKFKMEF